MKYIFILAVGRSGTSWISKVLASSPSPLIYFEEPLSRFKKHPENDNAERWSMNANVSQDEIDVVCNKLKRLPDECDSLLRPAIIERSVYCNSDNPEFVIVKEVHNLSIWHRIVEQFDNYEVIIIERDPLRILDSYFYNFKKRNNYRDEYRWLRECVLDRSKITDSMYRSVVNNLPLKMIEYIERPIAETEEYIRFFISIVFCQEMLFRLAKQNNTIYISYELICSNPIRWFSYLCAMTGLEFGPEVEMFLNRTREKDEREEPYSIFRNSYLVGDGNFKYLTDEQIKTLKGFL